MIGGSTVATSPRYGCKPPLIVRLASNTFIRRGRLTQIPAQRKKRQIILEKLAEEFEPGREYAEREVNQILVEFHDDVAALRRGLIEHGLMERTEGVYRRLARTPNR